jgi:XTP/dITP diphosphohydrolase
VLPQRLLVATRNAGKLAELRAMFGALGVEVVDLDQAGVPPSAEEDGIEDADSFEGNALAKARWYRMASGGLATVADDSGLEVLALGGAPGIQSRRWAGASGSAGDVDAANNARLLRELDGRADRTARFVCAVAWIDDVRELVVRGETQGRVADAPSGTGGFGYDPLFVSDDLGRSFGEATREEKAAVSHRARALRALVSALHAGAPTPVDPDAQGV